MTRRNMLNGAMVSLAVVCMTVMFAGISPASANVCSGIITVTTLNDEQNVNGLCSLREAITNADSNSQAGSTDCAPGCGTDTINFSVSGTITLSSGLPNIYDTAGLTIDGTGQTVTISGNNTVRIAQVVTGALTLNNLTIANGYASSGGGVISNGTVSITNCTFSGNHVASGTYGGAIYNSGTLTITNSTFSGNSTPYYGGGIYNREGSVTITDSTFSGNNARYGGGILNYGTGTVNITGSTFSGNSVTNGRGGGIWNSSTASTMSVTDSTFYNNSASDESGGGGICNNGTLTVTNSTFSGNSSTASNGGAIANNQGSATITNCTFTGNNIDGIHYGGCIFNLATITIMNSTFSGNSAGFDAVLYNGGTATLSNTIVANSTSGGNCGGTITNGGYNIDDGTTCGWGSANGSLSGTGILLDPLADNGGPTDTMALVPGSPAIDRIPHGVNGCGTTITTDQRGFLRPSPSGGSCDIGAYEVDQETFDLSGSWSVLYSMSRGTNLSGILRTQNTGNANAGSFKVVVYLSANGTTLGNLLKTYTVSGLNAGTAKNISFSYISNISLSGKYLIAVIDSGSQISETDESNNRAKIKIQ